MSARHLSRYTLERHVAKLLSEDEASAARAHLDGCGHCRERAEELEADAAAYLVKYPNPPVPRASAWSRLCGRLRHSSWSVAAASAAAAVIAVVVLPQVWIDSSGVRPTPGRSDFELRVGQGTGGDPFTGQTIRSQDMLQIRYSTDHRYLILLRVDPDGEIQTYLPAGEDRSAPIAPGQRRRLPLQIALDPRPGPQRIVGVVSDAPLEVEHVRQAIRARLKSLAEPARQALDLGALPLEAEVVSWLIPRVVP